MAPINRGKTGHLEVKTAPQGEIPQGQTVDEASQPQSYEPPRQPSWPDSSGTILAIARIEQKFLQDVFISVRVSPKRSETAGYDSSDLVVYATAVIVKADVIDAK